MSLVFDSFFTLGSLFGGVGIGKTRPGIGVASLNGCHPSGFY